MTEQFRSRVYISGRLHRRTRRREDRTQKHLFVCKSKGSRTNPNARGARAGRRGPGRRGARWGSAQAALRGAHAARGPRTARPNRTVFRPLAAIPNEPKEPQKSASRGMGRARHRTSSPAGRWPQRSRCHRHLFTYRRGTPSSQAFLNWTLRIQEHSSRVRHTREGGEGQGSAGHVGFIRDGSRPRPAAQLCGDWAPVF